ncbi:MAG: serine protein kinase RIO [Candidatus Diapherotrites archaeon]|nr:serine protein kinase RIO [Candidatus Diapherotrites archaeon]
MQSESKEPFDLRKVVPNEEQRKTFAKVFDRSTIQALHRLAAKGYFNVLEFVVSTGKEAHVFRAVDKAGNYKAVKIYKTSTSDFNKMGRYIEGDTRFKGIPSDKRKIVFEWTRKEYKNLLLMNNADVRAPMPIASFQNVLVMEFIGLEGNKGEAAPPLRQAPPESFQKAYSTIIDMFARLLFKCELAYADFSEYNILNTGKELVLIDAGQAVLTTHPEAESFFDRDLRNVANYFSKNGFPRTLEQIKADVKALQGKI